MSNETTEAEHDSLTHLVDHEGATVTVCGIDRTIWVSATMDPMFATCEECVAASSD